jgi:hydrophobic/amphiphilic exporter-1 (mainly G- bacteria), HAE1 family
MYKFADFCIRRPVLASMMILALLVAGAAAYSQLGVDRFPDMEMPRVVVTTNLPGASAVEVESQVTERIEEAVNTIGGIDELTSISAPGRSVVRINLQLGADIDVAAADVRDRIAAILGELPREIDPPIVGKVDSQSSPVIEIALHGERTMRELTEFAERTIKRRIERAAGVGEVRVVGGLERAINLWVDPARLAAYNLPITAVRDAVLAQNVDIPGGHVTAGPREQTLRTMGRLLDPQLFDDMVVETRGGTPIRLSDIGRAEDGTKELRSIARLNGEPAVTIEVLRQTGANSIAVIDAVKAELAIVAEQLPSDIRMEIVRDQSNYIHAALHEINTHLVMGSILACLVILLFMRSWRSMVIAGIAIPVSLISVFAMMWVMDFTLNSVTMLALVLMVGVVIDNALVVLENIFRFVEEKGMSAMDAAREATGEIGSAVVTTTLCLVAIFVPVSFMSSISGLFLFQFGLTAAVAVLVSLLVSFVLTPMMSARMLSREQSKKDNKRATSRGGFYRPIDSGYVAALTWAVNHRLPVVILAVLVMASAVPIYGWVQQEWTPSNIDESEFEVVLRTPEGVSIEAMDDVMAAMERELMSIDGVKTVLASVGAHLSSSGTLNQTRAFVRIEDHSARRFSLTRLIRSTLKGDPRAAFRGNYTQRDIMAEARARLRQYPSVRVSIRNVAWFQFGSTSAEIDFILQGPDLENLAKYAQELSDRADELGIVDADATLQLDRPELQAEIDRERASRLNVAVADIATGLRLMVGGDERVSRFRDPNLNEEYDVQLRLDEGYRNDPDTIATLFVPTRMGDLVRLDNLVELTPAITASRIDRLDRQRQVSLRANVASGYGLADRVDALRTAVDEMNLPPMYTTYVSGGGRELERTFIEFLWAIGLSLIFVYIILAAQYERLTEPLVILLTVPLTVPFAFFTLWLFDQTLNLYAGLGLLVLFGVAMKQAILQVDHTNQLRDAGLDRTKAIIQANRDRLRPILMTVLTLVAGMSPLVIGAGPGAEERRAVAVIVIGGLCLSLLLTLIVIPVAYSLLDDVRSGIRRVRYTMFVMGGTKQSTELHASASQRSSA